MNKFELFKDAGGQYRFRLRGPDGKVLLNSEPYDSIELAENAIIRVKVYGQMESQVERKLNEAGHWYQLHCAEGKLLGHAGFFNSENEMEETILQLNDSALEAVVDKLSQ